MNATIIKNVKIFDGEKFIDKDTLAIKNGIICEKTAGGFVVDGTGCTLIPGLIDSHVHISNEDHLKDAAKAGITTIFEMANKSVCLICDLRNKKGLTNIISCIYPAVAENKMNFPESAVVKNKDDAKRYINKVIEQGADFIKIIIEDKAKHPVVFEVKTVRAIVKEAHDHGKLTVSHVTTVTSYKIAIEAGVDVLTHIPLTQELSDPIIDVMKKDEKICIPTMVMMKGIIEKIKNADPFAQVDFNNIIGSVKKMREANLNLLIGTDSNNQPNFPCQIPHGISIYDELELFTKAGFTAKEALASATVLPAKVFGLKDRGMIKEGLRADLMLVKGDPVKNISDIRNVKGVWIEGVLVER